MPPDNQYLYERGFTCSTQGGSKEGGMTLREVMQPGYSNNSHEERLKSCCTRPLKSPAKFIPIRIILQYKIFNFSGIRNKEVTIQFTNENIYTYVLKNFHFEIREKDTRKA